VPWVLVAGGQDAAVGGGRIAALAHELSATAASSRSQAIERYVAFTVVVTAPDGGLGSGVVVSRDGRIVTGAHVTAGFRSVSVELPDARVLAGKVIATEKRRDLALVQVDATGLSFARFGTEADPGEEVYAVGTPDGLEATVTAGSSARTVASTASCCSRPTPRSTRETRAVRS